MEGKHNKTGNWAGAVLVAAIAASLCCITPVLAFVAGVGGIAASLSWLEPLRPLFIGITVIVLGIAWYQQLKPKKEIDCDCETNETPSFWQSKIFLGIVTLLAVLLLAFPYYANVFYPNNNRKVVFAHAKNIQRVNLNIEGMTCAGCEAHINHLLSEVEGVIEVNSDHETGRAEIKIDTSKAAIDKIIKAVEATGYKVVKLKLEGAAK
ncbi:MAG TPA: mercuric transport protein MerTP [bacterium]|nr:mercuric transport protein MerTP [bacterium]